MKKEIDIITIGSATIDVFLRCTYLRTKEINNRYFLELNEKSPIDDIEIHTGGGATNTSATFRNLGFSVKTICAIGHDYHGKEIQKDLVSRGIKTSSIQILDNSKTGYSTILSTGGKNRAIFVYRGASAKISHRSVAWKNINAKLFYISSLNGNLRLLSKAIMTASRKKIKVAWNPGGQEIKYGIEELAELLNNTDYLILNQKEAEIFSGGSLLAEPKMFKILKRYTKGLVIVTYGDRGAKIYDGKKLLIRKSIGKKVLDSTGAGDAFGAGFTGMMLKTNNINKAFNFALKNSGNVITRLGAKNGLISP